MKHWGPFLFLICLLGAATVSAQNKWDKWASKADLKFDAMAYDDAIPLYKRAIKKGCGSHCLIRMAQCHYFRKSYADAIEWYMQAMDQDSTPPGHWLEYGQVLVSQGFTEDALVAFRTFQQKFPDDPRGQAYVSSLEEPDFFYRDSADIGIFPIGINTEYAEFSPSPFRNGIVYASDKEEGKPVKRVDAQSGGAFYNLWYAEPKDSVRGKWKSPQKLSGLINTQFHESGFTYDPASEMAWFSRNNFLQGKKGRSESGVMYMKLYGVQMKKNKGKEPEEFPHNSDEYNLMFPAFSPDGKTLYYSSDMPGGQGGRDLYMSVMEGDTWSLPRNLGPRINTIGDEVFPFAAKEGWLYFASNGHPGMGNLDIFKVNLKAGSPVVENLGYPVNSPFDDLGFFPDQGGDTGFFSSNREGGKGSDDLYGYALQQPTLFFKIEDSVSGLPIVEANFMVRDSARNVLGVFTSDTLGKFSIKGKLNTDYEGLLTTYDFEPKQVSFTTRKEAGVRQTEYTIRLYNPPPAITARVVDQEKDKPLEGALVQLVLLNEDSLVPADTLLKITDRYGRFSMKLQPRSEYKMFVRMDKYFTYSADVRTTRDAYDGDTIIPMKLEPIVVDKPVVLRNIHYDYDKFDIREDAKPELMKIVDLMALNPDIRIEMGSHTDARGSDAYNERLSERRAEAARSFLIEKGIPESRITSKGYGESMLLNDCRDDADCPEADHEVNRRTEFKVIGFVKKWWEKEEKDAPN